VYADSAYASEKTNQYLKEQQIENGVLERTYRNKPLTTAQKAKNKIKSRAVP
jgi:IS5 family transposase